ncbi:MAG: prepilin-type N-terminal cleavage/methylation domain-containing protein [bacterium]|nr:prepilin-type N-terminal cleavage/methylation domain-containing protein [bacterium]
MNATRRRRSRAFTLIELLVVVSIIALLISILLPSLKQARAQAKDVVCRSNLHQLGLAIQYYASDNGDRIPWIKGAPSPSGTPTNFPFRQYHQILHMQKYLGDLRIYLCPRAQEGPVGGRPGGGIRGPKSVKGYREGDEIGSEPGPISYYTVRKSDDLFIARHGELFPTMNLFETPEVIEELYTEYWLNDWNYGAGDIPAISGAKLTRIPQANYAVMMMDAIDWNPRHSNRTQNFLFADAHVDPIGSDNYFDPQGHADYANARDKDAFGNRPYWAWGLGKGIIGE